MGLTNVYGLPFLDPDDGPDIAGATQSLAEATEAELERIDLAFATTIGFEALTETTPQSVPASTVIAVKWQSASSNVGNFGKPSAFEWTVPTAGVYAASIQGEVNNGQTGRAYVDLLLDSRRYRSAFGGFSENAFGVTGTRRLAANAIIKVELFCATATTLRPSTLVVYKIGA